MDKIVSSEVVDNSVKSLPAITSALGIVAVLVLLTYFVIRRIRRRKHPILAPVDGSFSDLEFDFDRILSEIKQKQVNTTSRSRVHPAEPATKKATQKRK